MKLVQIFMTESKDGTYAGVHFSKKTRDNIIDYVEKHNIPNLTDVDDLHTTLLYSRKHLPNYVAAGRYETPLIGKPLSWKTWKTQEGKTCLVLPFECKELYQRHKDLMKEHKATWDYDDYKPHITLSYDIGDDFDTDTLPHFSKPIEITEEYSTPLDLNWTSKKK